MAIYLGNTLLTSSSSGGGGGGVAGIPKQYIFTTSGSLDLTTLGIADGDAIGLFMVGGGGGADARQSPGWGGNVWSGSVTLGTAGTVSVTIGAGGAGGSGGRGGSTSITGGGITGTISTGTSNKESSNVAGTPGSPGYVWGGAPAGSSSDSGYGQTGIHGFAGGGSFMPSGDPLITSVPANTGRGGDADESSLEVTGASGILILYYL